MCPRRDQSSGRENPDELLPLSCMALATDPHFTDKTISYTTVATLPEGDQRNKKSSYTAMARDHYIKMCMCSNV